MTRSDPFFFHIVGWGSQEFSDRFSARKLKSNKSSGSDSMLLWEQKYIPIPHLQF